MEGTYEKHDLCESLAQVCVLRGRHVTQRPAVTLRNRAMTCQPTRARAISADIPWDPRHEEAQHSGCAPPPHRRTKRVGLCSHHRHGGGGAKAVGVDDGVGVDAGDVRQQPAQAVLADVARHPRDVDRREGGGVGGAGADPTQLCRRRPQHAPRPWRPPRGGGGPQQDPNGSGGEGPWRHPAAPQPHDPHQQKPPQAPPPPARRRRRAAARSPRAPRHGQRRRPGRHAPPSSSPPRLGRPPQRG